jgi:hypothetical protein
MCLLEKHTRVSIYSSKLRIENQNGRSLRGLHRCPPLQSLLVPSRDALGLTCAEMPENQRCFLCHQTVLRSDLRWYALPPQEGELAICYWQVRHRMPHAIQKLALNDFRTRRSLDTAPSGSSSSTKGVSPRMPSIFVGDAQKKTSSFSHLISKAHLDK